MLNTYYGISQTAFSRDAHVYATPHGPDGARCAYSVVKSEKCRAFLASSASTTNYSRVISINDVYLF